jgi:peptidyl-prolyl cis-trans isomerase C/foldase protein PrsA
VRTAVDQGLVSQDAMGEDSDEHLDHRQALEALLDAAPAPEPTEAEMRERYRAEKARFTLPERVRLSQILVDERATAEKAAAALAEGTEFAEVARTYSIDPSAPYGGGQGELSRADLPEEFAAIIFRLQPGEVSDIVEADYGFHIFKVTERLPARTVPFEEAAPSLRARLREERAADHVSQLVTDARNRYTVRVYDDHLPFDYRGSYPTAPSGDGPVGS